MNVLTSVWVFKTKCFPDELLKKLEACFCVGGIEQKEGIDYFDTYSPVVKWITVITMLVLTVLLGIKSKQVGYTAAFLHASVFDDIFVEMPRTNIFQTKFSNEIDPFMVSNKAHATSSFI